MKTMPAWVPKFSAPWLLRGIAIAGVVLFFATMPLWWPGFGAFADRLSSGAPPNAEDPSPEHPDEHDHGHENPSITLSPSARLNIGLRVSEVKPEDFPLSITVPALVTERPGENRYDIVAPFTGIVTGLHVVAGQMVESSDLLFTLRLTHEDLVKAQKEFLATLGQLDVEQTELARLKEIDASVMARKVLLEKQYQIETLEASLKAQRNALHLHGLDTEQIARIETERTLVREMKIFVPFLHRDSSLHGHEESERHLTSASDSDEEHELIKQEFLVQQLDVHPGQAVETGQALCHLANYQTLYIEGRAFEQDAPAILAAARSKWGVEAVSEGEYAGVSGLENLPIVRIANEIETQSRALHFYVELPNEIAHQSTRGQRRFATWRFKPGQRMQLRVPVDLWKDVFVLPVEAVAQEGPETYVFVENGKRLERRAVHVIHRDQTNAVIGNNGSLFPQESVAMNAAHQLLMALKNQSGGGGGDPHAGHMH